MRRVLLDASLAPAALLDELARPGPLLLELECAPPGLPRLPLLAAAAGADALLFVRFAGTLTTPLAELALLARAAELPGEGARLDLSGALLSPLIARLGLARARRLLARGPVLRAADVLPPFAGPSGRSATALREVFELLASAASPRGLLARERAAFSLVMGLPDRSEGVRAFREKRPPRFDW